MNTIKNKIYLTLVFFLAVGNILAQKVDTMVLNGENYFVYPFKVSVNVHGDYFKSVKLDDIIDFTYEHYGKEIKSQFNDEVSYNEFKKMMKTFNPKNMGGTSKKNISRKLIKQIRKNPYPLLEQSYTMGHDIVPSLDPIPDGKYVQLYESFCLVDSKGHCQEDAGRIAAYFTIKNNLLEGDAYWLNMKGDTLKYGKFEGGLKVGDWVLIKRDLPFALSKKKVERYINEGAPDADTVVSYYSYVNGAKNGHFEKYLNSEYPITEGTYTDDEKTGEWLFREVQYKGKGKNRKRIRNNELVTLRYTYADKSDTILTKKPLIRNGLIDTYNADVFEFNFISKYDPLDPPRDIFEYNFSKEESLDMEEELYGSYSMDSYGEDVYYDDYFEGDYYGEGYDYGTYTPEVYDKERESYFSRGYIVDSIGMIANYKGVYEAFYPNGQLAYRYELENGELKSEDTVFWDNGNAHDVVVFNADSNQYVRSIYDYDGKLYKELIYDSLGDYDHVGYYFDNRKMVVLDGLKAYRNDYGNFYMYDVNDTLEYELTEPLILFRSWYEKDSSQLYNTEYDPTERVITGSGLAVTGKVRDNYKRTFSEEFNSWTGVDTVRFSDIDLVTTSSGSLYEGEYFHDSIPQRNVRNAYNRFDVADDYTLYRNGNEYTGPVELTFNTSKLKVSKGDLKMSLPKYKFSQNRKLRKKISNYREKGKGQKDILLNYIDASDYESDLGSMIYYDLFNNMLGEFFYYPEQYNDYMYGYDYGMPNDNMDVRVIKGYMVDGKPHGVWKSYNKKGKVMQEVPFEKGLVHGTVRGYSYAYPEEKNDYYYYEEPDILKDSFPSKKTYYLSGVSEYKNGLLDGKETYYNWLNEITSETNYKEGMKHGRAIERNKLAYTRMNFEDDLRDGYMQTYLTLPGEDSVLLYDLNFQHGLLQGESKSYHINGKLSKRGFFLDGEPIDDYEAFDSLGFKYHYVKFKYSYPVEEKIWEENELSVRYLFDWQDSIYFVPSDITTSQSLEKVLFDLGFGQEYLAQPYYGRPSLVNKKGIKYHMTKYFPNDTVSRDGDIDDGKKVGCWKFYNYEGEFLYEVDYFDTILVLNDSVRFHSKGILTDVDSLGNTLYQSYIIEKFEKYDCSHTDHYEIRQLYTISESNDSIGRMNGYVKNYYDNGVIQSEGEMKDGLPTGFWKIYDPFGKLNQYGQYVLGKRDGRWLSGDLSKTKYLGDICLNPNLPDLEKEIKYRENLLDIVITNFKMGKALNKQYYDINMNRFEDVEEDEGASEE